MENNEPVAIVKLGGDIEWLIDVLPYNAKLYTHPAKENTNSYMVEVLNNTLNMERNHNEKAYKELYALCEKLAKENEALKAKTLTDEEIYELASQTASKFDGSVHVLRFARAILRKAQERTINQ